jgi:hypothetical protein
MKHSFIHTPTRANYGVNSVILMLGKTAGKRGGEKIRARKANKKPEGKRGKKGTDEEEVRRYYPRCQLDRLRRWLTEDPISDPC